MVVENAEAAKAAPMAVVVTVIGGDGGDATAAVVVKERMDVGNASVFIWYRRSRCWLI